MDQSQAGDAIPVPDVSDSSSAHSAHKDFRMWNCPQASSGFAVSEAASAREAGEGRADAKLALHAADDCPPGLMLRHGRASPVRAWVAVVPTDTPSLEGSFSDGLGTGQPRQTNQPVTQRLNSHPLLKCCFGDT